MIFTHPTDHLFIVYTATYEQTPGWVEGGDMDPARLEYYRSRLPLSPLLPQDSWKFDKRHPNRVEPNLYFDFWLVDLANIDEVRRTVDVDIWIYCQWTPALPELRVPGPQGEDPVILAFPTSHSELMSFWDRNINASPQRPQLFFPQLHMIGPHGLQPVFNPVQNPRLTYSDGLSEDLHFRGPVRYSPNLAWYPFDSQVVILTFTVPASCDRLLLTVPPEVFVSRAARAAKSGMSGWRLTDSRIKRLFHSYAILGEFPRGEISISQMSDYTSSIELKLQFSRRWGYQVLQKVVPLDLIVFAGWIVFLIPKGDPEEDVQIARLALGVTVLLALAAFNVSITAGMPKNPSPTLMDFHAVWSFL
ncbi:hypothetical protein AURDEDRAFT_160482 [Auricularia subglabra TFB-10046 SS5]|nr:hypothetical protein AURDEDRAFT_160482 [Auricularia subglabra TFB-10046 SS5]